MKRDFNMKAIQSVSFLFAIALGFLGACGSVDTISDRDLTPEAAEGTRPDGMDSKIYGSYRVTVDGDSQSYEAHVTLRVGGSTGTGVMLTEPNRIELDGAPMWLDDTSSRSVRVYPSSYWLRKPSAGSGSIAVFKWFQGSKVFTNSLKLAGSVASSLPHDFSVPRDRDLVIPFTGPALQAGERVVVQISTESRASPVGGEPVSPGYWRQVVVTGQEARMTAAQVNAFVPGTATLYISRELDSSVTQGHGAGGRMQSVYHGPSLRLNF
jgi:hypothetical protein